VFADPLEEPLDDAERDDEGDDKADDENDPAFAVHDNMCCGSGGDGGFRGMNLFEQVPAGAANMVGWRAGN